jgi:hypothetical protein
MRRYLPKPPTTRALVLGAGTVAILFAWEGYKGFTLWDEGFLWYGVQRVALGEVPIRDFQAYDPGRYYWSAFFMLLTGMHGLMALRWTLVVVQAAASAAALSLVANANQKRSDTVTLFFAALVLGAWMLPRYKVIDIWLSIALVLVLNLLVRRPSRACHFVVGITVGVAACFGRNHGVYGVVASLCALGYLAINCQDWRSWRLGAVALLFGIVLGYLPVLLMLAFVRGFAPAFIDSVKLLLEVKATNLPLPVPWPWRLPGASGSPGESVHQLFLGLFFVALVLFVGLSLAYVLTRRLRNQPLQPLLVACAFAALPYAHYTFSRADASHLAMGMFPMLIAVLALSLAGPMLLRWAIVGGLCVASWVANCERHPGWLYSTQVGWERIAIGNDEIWSDPYTAGDVALLHRLKKDFAPSGQSFFVAPFWPGAYALLQTRSPTWEIYAPWPKSSEFQHQEIARLEAAKPTFIVILDYALDGRDELRYRATHPLMEQYIQDHFEMLKGLSTNPAIQIFRPADASLTHDTP